MKIKMGRYTVVDTNTSGFRAFIYLIIVFVVLVGLVWSGNQYARWERKHDQQTKLLLSSSIEYRMTTHGDGQWAVVALYPGQQRWRKMKITACDETVCIEPPNGNFGWFCSEQDARRYLDILRNNRGKP